MFTRRLFRVVAVIVLAAAVPGTAQPQDAFDRAKSLYLEAAYEDALALLEPTGPNTADVHLYRALCLLALGRAGEADAAIARSIEVDPLATAGRQDVSPRVAALLADARRRMLPDLARRRVADGRLAYQQGDRMGATQRFEAAVVLLDDPTLASQTELSDLRTLASGFLDLIRAQSAPTAATPTAPAVAPAAASTTPPPAPATPAPALVVTRPMPLTQAMPPWRPPDLTWSRRELRGSILLDIDAAGQVTSAQMEQSVYPAYDRLLLEAVRTWRYQPAMRDGQPTTSQLLVPILLRPQTP